MNEIVALTVGFTKEFITQKNVNNLIIFAETIFWRRNYYRLWFLINSPFFNALSKLKTFCHKYKSRENDTHIMLVSAGTAAI